MASKQQRLPSGETRHQRVPQDYSAPSALRDKEIRMSDYGDDEAYLLLAKHVPPGHPTDRESLANFAEAHMVLMAPQARVNLIEGIEKHWSRDEADISLQQAGQRLNLKRKLSDVHNKLRLAGR
jgi:hypothetical protein